MNYFGYAFVGAVIALRLLGIVLTISLIGKERKPITPSLALSALSIGSVVIGLGIWTLWSNR